jgi:hypothetical protein
VIDVFRTSVIFPATIQIQASTVFSQTMFLINCNGLRYHKAMAAVEGYSSSIPGPSEHTSRVINDTAPPQISTIHVTRDNKIAWTTDEFATSEVRLGTGPGTYPQDIADPLYVKQHEITLPVLVPGTTYYCVVRSVDLSGNQAQSDEKQFKAVIATYLPAVLKKP